MKNSRSYRLILILLILQSRLMAQDITGTWEGSLGSYQFLQLNIIQNGDKLCGYSWDFVKKDQRDYCVAYFDGYYDKKLGQWVITGTAFVENSGMHTLMKLNLRHVDKKRLQALEGSLTGSEPFFVFPPQPETDPRDPFRIPRLQRSNEDTVYLRKVSSRPAAVLDHMQECYEKKFRTFSPVKTDTLAASGNKAPDKPVIEPPRNNNSTDPVKRKNREQSIVTVSSKHLTLNVYDNAVIDGDTVSIFYNGKLLISRQRLSDKPIVLEIDLDEKQERHEITMVAENLGSIPPNTALIVVYAGNKRYELFSSASLEENAVLVFEYKPN